MASKHTRRDVLIHGGLGAVGFGLAGAVEWTLPVLAQSETLVPFADMPEPLTLTTGPDRRIIDVRRIEGAFTTKDQFFTTQHYGHPDVDPATFRLKVSGLVERPQSLSLDDLRRLGATELVAGFECSGNRRPLQGLASNGRWTGVPLKTVLDRAGVKAAAREFVFFGADHGQEEVEFRTQKINADQQFGRSLPRDKATSPEPFLAYALNGDPLTKAQGAPLRLLVPGWYGVANVKWLSEIHLQEEQYLGKFQARWYRTVRGEMVDGRLQWNETAVTHMQLKSFVARVSRSGNRHDVLVVVLNDGTPIKSVEIRVDDGPWQAAKADPSTSAKYSWKLYRYAWTGATPGEHTLVSRVTDAAGRVQPTAEDLESKKTFLEDNSQHPRKVTIAS